MRPAPATPLVHRPGWFDVRIQFGTYPWAFETPGGGEMQLRKYAEFLPSHGVDVQLYDPWRRNLDSDAIFHFFSCVGGSVHLCAYIKQRGLPLVISSSLWLTEQNAHLYPLAEIRAQLSLADVIVTNSTMESEALAGILDLPLEAFAVVANGVDPTFAAADPVPFRARFSVPDRFVLNVGNIEPRKNQLVLVRALRQLDLPLVLIGHVRDPDYADQVLAEGGDKLSYLGPLDHDDPALASAFAACAVFALPSTLETPGLAALEAAAAGARLVVTREGCASEYFAELATYADPSDPRAIANAIESALARDVTATLQSHVTAHYGWAEVTKILPGVYRLAQDRHRHRTRL
jgi:glycosyltransferase involved in cell wall biosynthesis